MAEVKLNIPDSKLSFFMELVNQLGFEADVTDFNIPVEHQEFVKNRIKTAKKEDYISWEEARKKLQLNSK